eukprot:2687021-Rhodomonas_salina.1
MVMRSQGGMVSRQHVVSWVPQVSRGCSTYARRRNDELAGRAEQARRGWVGQRRGWRRGAGVRGRKMGLGLGCTDEKEGTEEEAVGLGFQMSKDRG